MIRPYRINYILMSCLFSLVLLNGCAGTALKSSEQIKSTAATTPPQPAAVTASHQKALNAIEENDYQQAVTSFQQSLEGEQLSDNDRYYFAKALYETGNYAAAIENYNLYIDNPGRRGDNFLVALEERGHAADKWQRQKEEQEKALQSETALALIAPTLDQNWLAVQQQLSARPASFTEPLTGMEMILVEGGCYQMGDQAGSKVCVDDFYLGKFEVTQGQWQQIMSYNPAQSSQGQNYPVETISWQEATAFAEKLGAAQGIYRLPTGAEWEYAARSGGKKQKFSGSDNVDAVAWHEDNSNGNSHPAGQKQPNGLGLYDMSGNVYEWCLKNAAENVPTRRGGSWNSRIAYSQTSYSREQKQKDYRHADTGFRLALPLPQLKQTVQ